MYCRVGGGVAVQCLCLRSVNALAFGMRKVDFTVLRVSFVVAITLYIFVFTELTIFHCLKSEWRENGEWV